MSEFKEGNKLARQAIKGLQAASAVLNHEMAKHLSKVEAKKKSQKKRQAHHRRKKQSYEARLGNK